MQEQAFRQYYVDRTLPVARAAIGTGVALVIAITIIDMYLMPKAFVVEVVPLRVMAMVVPMLGVVGATFLFNKSSWFPYLLQAVAILVGVSSLLTSYIATQTDTEMVFGGTIFLTFSIYLVLGLNFRQSMMAGWSIYVTFLGMGIGLSMPAHDVIYGGLLLGASNLFGTYASYRLERNAREIFDNDQALKRLARTDVLSGLYNRRTFDEHFAKVWKQARRDDKQIAIVIADIDHFKLYNDCYGNPKGDACIKRIAATLGAVVSRPLDLVARYNGAEFAMILYDPTPVFLESFTRSLCHQVVDLDIEHRASEATPTVSLSVGAAIAEAAGNMTPDQLLRQADDALYEAKSQGRNQSIVYRTEWGQQTTSHLAAVLL